MKSRILSFLRAQGMLQTAAQLAERLETPVEAVRKELYNLKASGEVHEITLEQLLRLEK